MKNASNPTTTDTEADLAAAVRRADDLRGQLADTHAERDAAIVALRHQGMTLAAIAQLAGMSEPGVLKLLRRHGVTT